MNNLSKKQKLILEIIVGIIIISGVVYFYTNNESSVEFMSSENLEIANQNEEKIKNKEETVLENTTEKIKVHISGAVSQEGIIELAQNSRIADAIEVAGGSRADADLSQINLAFVIEDGMKIYVPSINDKNQDNEKAGQSNIVESNNNQKNHETVSKSSGTEIETSNNEKNIQNYENGTQLGQNKNTKININTATQEQLETLPGIGPSTALKIINFRKENGNFKSIDDIKNVSGIGEAKFSNIKELIKV